MTAVAAPDALGAAVSAALQSAGPHFVRAAEETDVPRIPHTPREIRDRFRRSVAA